MRSPLPAAAACILAVALPAGAIVITCRDGGGDEIQAFGRRFDHKIAAYEYCDLDHTCDGICTFHAFSPHLIRCDFLGGPGCDGGPCVTPRSNDAAPAIPQCYSPDEVGATYAISLQSRVHRRTFFHGRVVVRCEPGHCATTTSTLPPGIPDLTGAWDVFTTSATDTCTVKPDLEFPSPDRLVLTQLSTDVRACGLVIAGQGEVSASGIDLNEPDCCLISNYDFGRRFVASLPNESGISSVHEEWTFSKLGPPGAPPICTRTADGFMVRVRQLCRADTDCIALEGCLRCIEGDCRVAPGCR